MKKAILIVVMLIFVVSSACAEIPDISGLSSDELLSLIHEAEKILFSERLTEGVKVPPGVYVVGEDIPAGTYRIEITDGTGFYDIYDKPDGNYLYSGLSGSSYGVTELGKIILEDGNIVKFVNSTFVFYPYVGIIF
ncbi:MAG: hypothetical protein IIX88_02660 [Firmicutes bacterium]|jgi:hypothetical protein|nr:hypothetical protein [Bacillota bacterium]